MKTRSKQVNGTAKPGLKTNWLKLATALVIIFAGTGLATWYIFFYVPAPHKILSITEKDFKSGPLQSSTVKVRELIAPYADHPVLGPTVKEVMEKLGDYDKLFEEAKKTSSGLQIDLILQDHGTAEEQAKHDPRVVKNQAKVAKGLANGKYDVVAVEGINIDPITMEGLARAVIDHGRKYDLPVPPIENVREEVKKSLPVQGGFQHMSNNPSAVVIGSEDEYLNHLHRRVLDYLYGYQPSDIPRENLEILNLSLSRLRSELAIAKVVLKLRQTGGKKGSIVMGYAHDNDMIEILKHLRIVGDVFSTDPKWER